MWYNGSKEDVLSRLGTRPEAGLTQGEVEQRREKYGKNELAHKKEDSLFVRFLAQFQDYMVIILLIAAAVSFAVSLLNGEADFFDPIIILSIVVLNADDWCLSGKQSTKGAGGSAKNERAYGDGSARRGKAADECGRACDWRHHLS